MQTYNSRFRGLSGFMSFRTPANQGERMDPAFCEPERRCTVCNAVLSQSNQGDRCWCHEPQIDIPDWAIALAEDMTVVELRPLSAVLRGERVSDQQAVHRELIVAAYEAGESQYEIARRFGVGRSAIQSVLRGAGACGPAAVSRNSKR